MPEFVRQIPAFLDEENRQTEFCNGGPDPGKAGGGDTQALQRIVLIGIETEGNDDRVGAKGADVGEGRV